MPMDSPLAGEHEVFPSCGAQARRWRRFEADLQLWLDTPHGRFARWRAEREVAGQPPFCARVAQAAQRPRTSTSA